jgi:hypothetical protein
MDMLRPAYTGTMAEGAGHRGVGAPLIVATPAEESEIAQPQPDPDVA